MREDDMDKLIHWQSSGEGKAYRGLCDFEDSADDLTDAIKSPQRDGINCLRENWGRFQAAKKKILDIEIELTPFAEAAE
jgi:hypothetical protein